MRTTWFFRFITDSLPSRSIRTVPQEFGLARAACLFVFWFSVSVYSVPFGACMTYYLPYS
jgi:hypothetical protein